MRRSLTVLMLQETCTSMQYLPRFPCRRQLEQVRLVLQSTRKQILGLDSADAVARQPQPMEAVPGQWSHTGFAKSMACSIHAQS